MSQLLLYFNTLWHHSSLMRLVVLSLWFMHYLVSGQSAVQSLVQYDALSQYTLYKWHNEAFYQLSVFLSGCDVLRLMVFSYPVLQGPMEGYFNVFPSIIWFCVCVCPCSSNPNPVFPMPSALYGFLFLSDCSDGSYRDGSHALRWKHSALDHRSCHPTHTHTHTMTAPCNCPTLSIIAETQDPVCSQRSINAYTHTRDYEAKTCDIVIQIYGCTCKHKWIYVDACNR